MLQHEASTVASIACTADGGCSHCATQLLDRLIYSFPEWRSEFEWAYRAAFDEPFISDMDFQTETL